MPRSACSNGALINPPSRWHNHGKTGLAFHETRASDGLSDAAAR